eukprot:3339686-Pyramimonas_sp.AAC.1
MHRAGACPWAPNIVAEDVGPALLRCAKRCHSLMISQTCANRAVTKLVGPPSVPSSAWLCWLKHRLRNRFANTS